MDHKDLIATAAVEILASPDQVWDALVNPRKISQYMLGTKVQSDWQEGSPITWSGEWKGKAYADKGKVLQATPGKALQYTHFSPLTGAEDKPENYHTVTIALSEGAEGSTRVTLTQDGNKTEEERAHSEKNWAVMLDGLRQIAEDGKLSATQEPSPE